MTRAARGALHLSPDLALPLDMATQTVACVGRKGSGKTYGAGKLVEEFLTHDIQVAVLDTVGNWYGLRIGADGKGPGFDVPVLGGLRGDVALVPEGGAVVADVLVETGRSLIVDISQFSKSDRKRFATAFAERLWARKKGQHEPTPLHLVLEEAQLLIPQRTVAGDERMLGIFEETVRLGRNYGIGVTMVTQRPQSVNKEALTQTEVLLVFQLNGVPERKTMREWIVDKGLDEDLVRELPALEVGHAFLWSPQFLRVLKRVRIGKKTTFDASATPKVGESKPRRALTPLDLDDVVLRMSELTKTIDTKEPSVLRRRIAELEAELLRARAAPRVEVAVPVLSPDLVRRVEAAFKSATDTAAEVSAALRAVTLPRPPSPHPSLPPARGPERPGRAVLAAAPPADPASTRLERGPREILRALASRHPRPLDKTQIATLAGYRPGGGGFNNYLGKLKGLGLISKADGARFTLTDEGRAAAGDVPVARSTDQLLELWASKVPGKARDILRLLVQLGPHAEGWPKEELAARVGMDPGGGGFNNYLGALRSNGLVVKDGGAFKASPTFFEA